MALNPQRIAVAFGRADRIDRGEGAVIAELARQPGRLIFHTAAAFDDLLQPNHIRRQSLELFGDVSASSWPVFAVVVQIEREQGHLARRCVG